MGIVIAVVIVLVFAFVVLPVLGDRARRRQAELVRFALHDWQVYEPDSPELHDAKIKFEALASTPGSGPELVKLYAYARLALEFISDIIQRLPANPYKHWISVTTLRKFRNKKVRRYQPDPDDLRDRRPRPVVILLATPGFKRYAVSCW